MVKLIQNTLLHIALTCTLVGNLFAADSHDTVTIEEVSDFAQLGRTLHQQRLPLVLMLSSSHCGYCVRVEQEFLGPMQISGYYAGRALIRKLTIDHGNLVVDFDGQRIEASRLARRYNATVTPTVLFLDGAGHQLTAKRVGLMTPDFYGGYLDESITTALDRLRRDPALRVEFGAAMNF
ncbi:MAG: thioredoxin fold domain-containing protein [Gammaproteobacteria bacterium]|nr:thioredoxin fold domain-containing protein [Gammaproteobacteria bacterium]